MINLLKWLLFPVFYIGGGKGGDSGQAAAADEARKAALRARIDSLYGNSRTDARPELVSGTPAKGFGKIGEYLHNATVPAGQAAYDADQAAADRARAQMTDEAKQVGDATRGYYTDQLTRSFGAAERNNRFNLARAGLQGGSADVDTNAELSTDRNLGATRIDQAARSAAANLDAQREQERMQAISLVNSGAGDSAVLSAQAGLKNSLAQAQNTNKVNLFSDLFTTGANGVADINQNAALAAMLGRYNQQLSSYFPTSSSGGRVTPSS